MERNDKAIGKLADDGVARMKFGVFEEPQPWKGTSGIFRKDLRHASTASPGNLHTATEQ
jgi:hypothetical protein